MIEHFFLEIKLGTNKFCLNKEYHLKETFVYDGEQLTLFNHIVQGHWQGHYDVSSVRFLSEKDENMIMQKSLCKCTNYETRSERPKK